MLPLCYCYHIYRHTFPSVHCLLYARVSTDKQPEKDLSIPAQLQLMREYARKQGWIGRYVDETQACTPATMLPGPYRLQASLKGGLGGLGVYRGLSLMRKRF